jgi:hypothetical protein
VVKQQAIDGIRMLPDSATWDDIMYCLYMTQKLESATRDIQVGAVCPHEQAREQLRKKWAK